MFYILHVPYLISDGVQCLQKEPTRHVENMIMMFNHAVNACTVCYFYNALFLCTRK